MDANSDGRQLLNERHVIFLFMCTHLDKSATDTENSWDCIAPMVTGRYWCHQFGDEGLVSKLKGHYHNDM